MNGILLVDKPGGVTSHDVVDHLRRASGIRRIGHTGTLDPAATGLLILCVGVATRLSEFLTGLDKVYEGAMRLGTVTDSYDLDGTVVEENPVPELTPEDLGKAFEEFTGKIMQLPPMVSAKKVDGERLYKKARKGQTVAREPRPVTVHEFVALSYEPPEVRFRLRCSRGTYARSIAYDLGQALGCGATLASLRRTWVGPHCVDGAASVDVFAQPDDVIAHLVPMSEALDLPHVLVGERGKRLACTGGAITRGELRGDCPITDGWIQVKTEDGQLLALAKAQPGPGGVVLHAKRVLVPDHS